MGLILDSSVIIAAERQGRTAYEMLEAIGAQAADPEIAVSVVTVLELAHGIARPNTGAQRAARQKFLDDLLTGMPVHPVTVCRWRCAPDRSTDNCRLPVCASRWQTC